MSFRCFRFFELPAEADTGNCSVERPCFLSDHIKPPYTFGVTTSEFPTQLEFPNLKRLVIYRQTTSVSAAHSPTYPHSCTCNCNGTKRFREYRTVPVRTKTGSACTGAVPERELVGGRDLVSSCAILEGERKGEKRLQGYLAHKKLLVSRNELPGPMPEKLFCIFQARLFRRRENRGAGDRRL